MSHQRRHEPHANGASPLPRHPATTVQQRAAHPAKIGATGKHPLVQQRAAHPAKAGSTGKFPPHGATILQAKAALSAPGPGTSTRPVPESRTRQASPPVAQPMLASQEPDIGSASDPYPRLVTELVEDDSHHAELAKLMAHDDVYDRSAAEQLAKCLEEWKLARDRDSLELAMCLYTTYFYSVVNKSMRELDYLDKVNSQLIRSVVLLTRFWLTSGFEVAEAGFIRTFRWELQSEWMKDAKVGERLWFQGYTSTHLSLKGVNSMVYDIRKEIFGKVTAPALLVFEGACQTLVPQTKYYPNETEYILPAGVGLEITDKYPLAWFLMDDKVATIFPVYHLKLTPVVPTSIVRLPTRKTPTVDFRGPRGRSRVCMLSKEEDYDLGLHTCT